MIKTLKMFWERTHGEIEEEEVLSWNFFENYEINSLDGRITRDEGSPYLNVE